jgi:hypothetical protein
MLKFTIIKCFFALLLLFAAGAVSETMAQVDNGPKSEFSVFYDAKSDQTVAMVNFVLQETGEQTVNVPNLSFMAVFAGKYLVQKPGWQQTIHRGGQFRGCGDCGPRRRVGWLD